MVIMITTEDKVFFKQMRGQMLELAVLCLKLYKRTTKPYFKTEYEFYYQQAADYEARINAVQ